MSIARVRGPGQSDQACDLIAAAIVEEYLRRDPKAQTNLHVSGGQGAIFVSGEVLAQADFDVAAIVRKTLGVCGVTAQTEPFIALELMAPSWAPPFGAREVCTVTGYATQETSERLPKAAVIARELARELERRRTGDADWFWLGADYVVSVMDDGTKPLVILRAEHIESATLTSVRERIAALVKERQPDVDVRVNPAGEETRAGLGVRIGASGRGGASDQFGSHLPANSSGVGLHLRHPLNLGAWIARSVAKELVDQGKGKAVLVQATWFPLEARPHLIRIRNERGENLRALINPDRFDLSNPPEKFLAPHLISANVRAPFDGGATLPWEELC